MKILTKIDPITDRVVGMAMYPQNYLEEKFLGLLFNCFCEENGSVIVHRLDGAFMQYVGKNAADMMEDEEDDDEDV